MSNSMYWVTTLIFSFVLFLIWIDERTDGKEQTRPDKAFSVMLLYGIFFCVQDMVWGLCDCGIIPGDGALFAASSVFHLAIVLTSYYCMRFFLRYLENDVDHKAFALGICHVIMGIQLMLVTLNFFFPVLFRIEGGAYVAKTYRPLSFINQYVVYTVSGVMTFSCIRKADKKHRDKYRAIFMVAIIPLITGIFQLYYVEAPFYSLGYFLECMIVHLFIITKDRNELSQGRILDSIANAYYSMHLFDLDANTMEVFLEPELISETVLDRTDARKALSAVLAVTVEEEYLDTMKEFMDLSTLSDRMGNRKSISMEFIGAHHGWTRADFIPVERSADGRLKKVMLMTQSIEEQKRREREMYAKSQIDQLTKLYNRRAYESDIGEALGGGENFTYVTIDINELKVVNDTLGHEAGDELIVGAARCMKQCFGPYGKVYRVGGDEFAVLLYASAGELVRIRQDFEQVVQSWKGHLADHLTVSSGYVTRRELAELSIPEMARIAEERMYREKAAWYKSKGVDRRGQAAAHTALCSLYTKILKINLTRDTYSIVNMDMSEQTKEKGFADTISGWLHDFGASGQVYKDDLEKYFRQTNLEYLKDYFHSGKTSISIFYRRRYGDIFKLVAMEMIPADDYAEDNQALFLYVKNIDI